MLNPCQYERLKIRKVQTLVRNYWSDLGKKASSRQHGFQHLPEPLSEKEKKYKKIPGLKIESDSEINSVPAIKGNLGLFELCNFCQTVYSAFSSGMGR